jgi:hypothetical protein
MKQKENIMKKFMKRTTTPLVIVALVFGLC